MLPHDPEGRAGVKEPLPDVVIVNNPKTYDTPRLMTDEYFTQPFFPHAPNAMPTRLTTDEETCFVAALRASSSAGSTRSASLRTSAVRRVTRLAIPPWPCVAKLASRSSNLVSALAIAACTIASSTTSREVGVPLICLLVLTFAGRRVVL